MQEENDFIEDAQLDPTAKPAKSLDVEEAGFVGFGVTADIQTIESTAFDIETPYRAYKAGQRSTPWPIAIIAGVNYDQKVKGEYTLKDGITLADNERPTPEQVTPDSIRHTLDFHFTDTEGVQKVTLTVFDIEPNDPKAIVKREGNAKTIGHVWDALVGQNNAEKFLSPEAIQKANDGKPIKSWAENWKAIATIFNTANKGNPVYRNANGEPFKLRIRLSYDSKGRVNFPLYGNRIERLPQDSNVPSTLAITKRDRFERPTAEKLVSGIDTTRAAESADWDKAFD